MFVYFRSVYEEHHFLESFKRGAFKIADHQLPVVPMVFMIVNANIRGINFGFPGELRVQTFPEFILQSMEELPVFQEEIRDIIDQGLRDDPKGRQFEAVALEEKRVS